MLTSLFVKNFAIIETKEIEFNNGLTVLTGETGAGKSLIIDAIGLLFGDRASSDLVRTGENKATVEGTFINYSDKVNDILLKYDIDNDDVLAIRREIYENGKSLAKVNGINVSLTVLNELGEQLGSIHNQFDTQTLVNANNYCSFLDNEKIITFVNNYKESLKQYKTALRKYNEFIEKENEINSKLDFLEYQYKELEKAKLSINEEEELQSKARILQNHEKIVSNANDFLDLYNRYDILDNIYQSINYLEKLSNYDEIFANKKDSLREIYYTLSDTFEVVKDYANQDDFDESELDLINERLSVYSSLKRKHKMSIEELINYKNELQKILENSENHDFLLQELTKEKNNLFNKTKEIGHNISRLRLEEAKKLKDALMVNLADLQLKNVQFEIEINQDNENSNNFFKKDGIDNVEFLISFNKGESKKSLSKTASGGELSRFMLALKAIASKNMINQTLIFDEIDTGVSGEIAHSIALKIKEIGEHAQVICVTHLPQVASIADYHYNISKLVHGDKTITNFEYLDYEGRVNNIALMISKGETTKASIELAKELLNKN